MCETGLVYSELSYMIKHTRRFSKEKRVLTPIAQYVSRSFTKPSPYGNVLIMSPWNYPFLLTIDPLIDALSAGNTAMVKPSAYSPATSQVLKKIMKEAFDPEYVALITGGREENKSLLNQKFDYIFFTGSQTVGKVVLREAAEHLTPVTLELGGKSPCIVDESANIKLTARRLVFGKYLNCGQTCVAPDYILCHESKVDELIQACKEEILRQFGSEPLHNPNYGKIINQKHFERVSKLIDSNKIVYGGHIDSQTLKIEPTILNSVTWEDPVMKEEIFGPIMPILTYHSIQEIPALLQDKPKPLAFYVFSNNKENIQYLTKTCQFGGGCINDVIIHLATTNMGFGGVGESGMGAYHGKVGFDTFSHKKSIVDKKTWIDLPMRYQPYTKINSKLVHFFMK